MREVVPASRRGNKGHYSPGVVSGGMLYVSGQLPVEPLTGRVVSGGVEEHARQALDNLDEVLKEAGCCRGDVVLCRVYVTDVEHWDAVNGVYAEFFGKHRPARVVVPVGKLHYGSLVEIEAVVEVGD